MYCTRIEFWRGTALSQCVEIVLAGSRLRQSRLLRLWFSRMHSIEPDAQYTVRIHCGSWGDGPA